MSFFNLIIFETFSKLKELTYYLELVILCRDSILITGSFNIHVDDPTNDESLKFLDLLESVGLEQHVNEPTHTYGHTLDLVITRTGDQILTDSPKTDFCLSDHISIICHLTTPKPPLSEKTIHYRKLKNVDISALKKDLCSSDLFSQTSSNINDFVQCFNTTLSTLLDAHAPLVKKTIITRPHVP